MSERLPTLLRTLAQKSNDGFLRGPAFDAADLIEALTAERDALAVKVRVLAERSAEVERANVALAENLDMMVHTATRLADLWDKDKMDRVGPATRQMRATLASIKEGG